MAKLNWQRYPMGAHVDLGVPFGRLVIARGPRKTWECLVPLEPRGQGVGVCCIARARTVERTIEHVEEWIKTVCTEMLEELGVRRR